MQRYLCGGLKDRVPAFPTTYLWAASVGFKPEIALRTSRKKQNPKKVFVNFLITPPNSVPPVTSGGIEKMTVITSKDRAIVSDLVSSLCRTFPHPWHHTIVRSR